MNYMTVPEWTLGQAQPKLISHSLAFTLID